MLYKFTQQCEIEALFSAGLTGWTVELDTFSGDSGRLSYASTWLIPQAKQRTSQVHCMQWSSNTWPAGGCQVNRPPVLQSNRRLLQSASYVSFLCALKRGTFEFRSQQTASRFGRTVTVSRTADSNSAIVGQLATVSATTYTLNDEF